jgi:hypothetical protein
MKTRKHFISIFFALLCLNTAPYLSVFASEPGTIQYRDIDKPAFIPFQGEDFAIVDWHSPDDWQVFDMLCRKEDDLLFPCFQTSPYGQWGIYPLVIYPDAEQLLPEWVAANLPGWKCEKQTIPTNPTLYCMLLLPPDETRNPSTAEWLDVCGKVYDALGFRIEGLVCDEMLHGIPLSGAKCNYTGDVDSDGSVSLKDVIKVLWHVNLTMLYDLDDSPLNAVERIAADVDLSGQTDAMDALCLLRYVHFRDALEEPKTWAEITGK